MYCPNCKLNMNREDIFCKICGSNLKKIPLENNEEKFNTNNNENDTQNIKKTIIKYLIKCYIPFIIIYTIRTIAEKSLYNKCYYLTNDFSCSMTYFIIMILFGITYIAIYLPLLCISTVNLLKKFNDNKAEIKKIDIAITAITGIAMTFIINKVNIAAFFLVPIIFLLYFSNNDVSKKTCQSVFITLIISSLISSYLLSYTPIVAIYSFNLIILPWVTIIFYLINQHKIKFKINKTIPIVLVLSLLIISTSPFLLKNTRSFAENVKKENINLKFDDLDYINEIVHVDDENIYMILSDFKGVKYLSKYDLVNDKLEILFSDVYITTSGDGFLFFNKANSIYMINTKTNEIKKIFDKLYYGNTYHRIHYNNENLHFSSGNKFYTYNIENTKISSFKLKEIDEIDEITNNFITGKNTEYFNTYYSWYDHNGNKINFSNSELYNPYLEKYIYQNYIFTFDFDNNIIIGNSDNKKSYKYSINTNDIYYDETNQYSIERFKGSFLGIYNNKIYIKISYNLKNNISNSDNIYNKSYSNSYNGIYYFDINNLDGVKNIKLNTTISLIKNDRSTNAYFLDKYIYLSDNKGKIYKYNLENNNITIQYVPEYCCEFQKSYSNYIYGIGNNSIYRIDKNNAKIEKILEIN